MDRPLWQYQFQIITLGDIGVGKSCIVERYTKDLFPESICPTVLMNVVPHFIEVEPGVRVKLLIWDMCGLDMVWPRNMPYYSNSDGCVMVFDLGRRHTFDSMMRRHKDVCKAKHPNTMLFVLLGHKSDLNSREVSQDEAEMFASENGIPYFETSAKTGQNVKEAFNLLLQRIYQGQLSGNVELPEGSKRSTPLDEPAEKNMCCPC